MSDEKRLDVGEVAVITAMFLLMVWFSPDDPTRTQCLVCVSLGYFWGTWGKS